MKEKWYQKSLGNGLVTGLLAFLLSLGFLNIMYLLGTTWYFNFLSIFVAFVLANYVMIVKVWGITLRDTPLWSHSINSGVSFGLGIFVIFVLSKSTVDSYLTTALTWMIQFITAVVVFGIVGCILNVLASITVRYLFGDKGKWVKRGSSDLLDDIE